MHLAQWCAAHAHRRPRSRHTNLSGCGRAAVTAANQLTICGHPRHRPTLPLRIGSPGRRVMRRTSTRAPARPSRTPAKRSTRRCDTRSRTGHAAPGGLNRRGWSGGGGVCGQWGCQHPGPRPAGWGRGGACFSWRGRHFGGRVCVGPTMRCGRWARVKRRTKRLARGGLAAPAAPPPGAVRPGSRGVGRRPSP